eukprot:NODE_1004_length_2328_cov_0.331090.p2 type:complete len:143 gc:universal NODE_1004_length_2328_cov_0.331090:705-1133(+)
MLQRYPQIHCDIWTSNFLLLHISMKEMTESFKWIVSHVVHVQAFLTILDIFVSFFLIFQYFIRLTNIRKQLTCILILISVGMILSCQLTVSSFDILISCGSWKPESLKVIFRPWVRINNRYKQCNKDQVDFHGSVSVCKKNY